MTESSSAAAELARFTLSVLVDDTAPRTPSAAAWPGLTALATDHRVLQRLHRHFEHARISMPRTFARAEAAERARARAMIESIERVERALDAAGINVVLPKAFMHAPDMGSDVDLLVSTEQGAAAAAVLMKSLGAVRLPSRLRQRMTGCAVFQLPGCPVPVDMHQGRCGPAGEQTDYAEHLLRHAAELRGRGAAADRTVRLEDQLVLQAQERVYGRRSVRLADLVFTMRLLRSSDLDWDYILAMTRRTAALGGLSCYLAYVDQIQQQLLGTVLLLPPHARGALRLSGWGDIAYRSGKFAFPAMRVGARLTLEKIRYALRTRRWRSAARICLLPFIAMGSARVRTHTGRQSTLALRPVHSFTE